MKNDLCRIFIVLIMLAGFLSCQKALVKQVKLTSNSISDTSTTIIANQELVGNWTLVSDSIHTYNVDTLYKGTQNDHYTFTKYGNMYINVAFNKTIDTAVYTITTDNRLTWINSYASQLGGVIKGASTQGYFSITSNSEHSLVLYQYEITAAVGPRTEEIKLKK